MARLQWAEQANEDRITGVCSLSSTILIWKEIVEYPKHQILGRNKHETDFKNPINNLSATRDVVPQHYKL